MVLLLVVVVLSKEDEDNAVFYSCLLYGYACICRKS